MNDGNRQNPKPPVPECPETKNGRHSYKGGDVCVFCGYNKKEGKWQ